jgi:WD40 repeat protein
MLWPTGAGTTRQIDLQLSVYGARWHPDGKSLVVAGAAENGARHLWRVDLESGERTRISSQPVLVDPVLRFLLSPDGEQAIALDTEQQLRVFPVSGGDSYTVSGALAGDRLAGWGTDGSIYVVEAVDLLLRIVRIDPQDGGRAVWREIRPDDPAGLQGVLVAQLTPDRSTLVYCFSRRLSELFLVEHW